MIFSEVEKWEIPEGEVYQVSDADNVILWRKKFNLSLTSNPSDGGTCLTPGKYYWNQDVTVNAVPNSNYQFLSWSDGKAQSHIVNMNGDISLTANFQLITFAVTLNTNGGTINSGNITSYTYGVGAILPIDVTKDDGTTFNGWFDNASLTGTAIASIGSTETGDKEFWAKWQSSKQITATITHDGKGKAIVSVSDPSSGYTAYYRTSTTDSWTAGNNYQATETCIVYFKVEAAGYSTKGEDNTFGMKLTKTSTGGYVVTETFTDKYFDLGGGGSPTLYGWTEGYNTSKKWFTSYTVNGGPCVGYTNHKITGGYSTYKSDAKVTWTGTLI